MKKKVVLAYSGGLDTSYCVKYLSEELNLEVISVFVNTGGFSERELQLIRSRALKLGVAEHHTLNMTQEFYSECLRFLIYGNVLRNGNYPLSVSAERVFQAKAIAHFAQKIGADFLAHGSTGAGNDQVRFDLIFQIICPSIPVITPIRDQSLSRAQEISYLKNKGVKMDWNKAEYSVNKGLWGTTIGGKETLSSDKTLPDEAYPVNMDMKDEQMLTLHFEKGEIIGVNEMMMKPVKIIQFLNELGDQFGIAREMHVGDTVIGIKGRVAFTASAPYVIIKAHQLLEKHVLTKWQLYWKDQLANWYGMFLHEGQFLEPVMRNIEEFLLDSQKYVSGKVILKLKPYSLQMIGIESDHDLMKSGYGVYGEENLAWTGEEVKGFTKILANSSKVYFSKHKEEEKCML